MKNRMWLGMSLMAVLLWIGGALAGPEMGAVTQPKNDAFDVIKGLAGTWVAVKTEAGKKPQTLVFKTTSGGSAVMESMFPGEDCEMVNLYTQEGPAVVMVHYCAMGNQPRMKATGIKDGVLKFEYVDGGNIKSRDDAHMDSVELTIKGDTLVEKWTHYAHGKVQGEVSFEFKKQG